ncbi:SDR family NAD(P)-dependent oxidoreductase [Mycobacterium sp.]|jgi:NAD(P)-dependent dehydrogenase (short-subunit alcohol dehydrogenase family)|uniref:SDR family NAD(P)-dependent oxidoreductase n=1 Tax=Mycobacterium sp. TaxID=1785 RepID=UPI002D6065A7|nr:SDR family NAD(P)-dependent oxidoreductase [Mycobacterium sp.]HZA08850.1 SDR family NAD(P)-dependent oxidoreductase [Mycobacterium sp.]
MPSVLVTGASRGIGRSISTRLADRGWTVVAGVRREQDGAEVVAHNPERISSVILDITDAKQIAALDDSLNERLDAVVNNAGVVVPGPLEAVRPEEFRRQFEVNVTGHFAVTQALLPRLRQSHGRIVFISSLNGRISVPLLGAYCASKFALEAAADALRMELAPWHIPVIVVQPTQTDTDMLRTADEMVEQTVATMTPEYRDLYAKHIVGMKKFLRRFRPSAVPADDVAAAVEEALTVRKPRARYVIGFGFPKLQAAAVPNLPSAARDRLLRRLGSQP